MTRRMNGDAVLFLTRTTVRTGIDWSNTIGTNGVCPGWEASKRD